MKRFANFAADFILASDQLSSLSTQFLRHESRECDIYCHQNYSADDEVIGKNISSAYRLLSHDAIVYQLGYESPDMPNII